MDHSLTAALERAATHAHDFLSGVGDRPVAPTADFATARARFARQLPSDGIDAAAVVDELAAGIAPDALTAMPGGRFFGFVIGATLPAALASDWLVSAWDQNAGLGAVSPGCAAVEDVAAEWTIDVLGLPPTSSLGFVTGGQMANFTCLAAARHHQLAQAGWEVEARGLAGAPRLRVIAGEQRHATIDVALRYLGLGAPETVAADDQGRLDAAALAAALTGHEGPLVVCAQAGNVNTGAFDPLAEIVELVHDRGGWVHVDGAFGLWAAAAPKRRHLLTGHDLADSWATDAHKWLNTPYDCGIAMTAHPAAHRSAMSVNAAYLSQGDGRDFMDWGPEFSRRARGVPVWAALRSLGRDGVADLVERCCRHASTFAAGLDSIGFEILNEVELNQVLVRLSDDDLTRALLATVQADGTCYPSQSTWQGRAAIRFSVSSWRTTDDDVERSLAAVTRCLTAVTRNET